MYTSHVKRRFRELKMAKCRKCGNEMVDSWPESYVDGSPFRAGGRRKRTICLDCLGETGQRSGDEKDVYQQLHGVTGTFPTYPDGRTDSEDEM